MISCLRYNATPMDEIETIKTCSGPRRDSSTSKFCFELARYSLLTNEAYLQYIKTMMDMNPNLKWENKRCIDAQNRFYIKSLRWVFGLAACSETLLLCNSDAQYKRGCFCAVTHSNSSPKSDFRPNSQCQCKFTVPISVQHMHNFHFIDRTRRRTLRS